MFSDRVFSDRVDAGRRLAGRLSRWAGRDDVVVVGLARGGVPVAAEVARALRAPLDVVVVKKLGVPRQPELAMGAIGEGRVRVVNDDVVALAGISDATLHDVEVAARAELESSLGRLRGGTVAQPLEGRTVIVVDDGLATGATARAACQVVRARGARRVVLAVPVASPEAVADLRADADDVVAVEVSDRIGSVGQAYRDFAQVPDETVVELLAASRLPAAPEEGAADGGIAGDPERRRG